MTTELSDWLTELGESAPAAAAEVGTALVAVLDAAEPSGLAIIGNLTTPYPHDPRETADYVYQQMLAELQHLRRHVADVATSRKRAELRLAERRGTGAYNAEIAELERERADAQSREAPLTELSLRLQWDVEVFRAAKESGKAAYAIAETTIRIAGAMQAFEGRGSGAETARLTATLKDANERMERVNFEGLETLHRIRDQVGQAAPPQPPQAAQPAEPRPPRPLAAELAPGLLELRADPLRSEIRILLAVEPADAVTLLAVLEGPEAVSEHGADAVRLASDLLTEIRERGWPADVDEVALEDSGAFLARFFPAHDGGIRRRAAALAKT